MAKNRGGWGDWEEENDDWTKVSFDDDDDEKDKKPLSIKFQIKEENNKPESGESGNSDDASSPVVLGKPTLPQIKSVRGRRGINSNDQNDEFDEITNRVEKKHNDTISSSQLDEVDSLIPAIVVHPFSAGHGHEDTETTFHDELDLALGDTVFVISKHGDNSEWSYGKLIKHDNSVVYGFFPSSFVDELCSEPLSFATAKEVVKPSSKGKVLAPRVSENKEMELDLDVDEEVTIIHKQNNGWWIGQKKTGDIKTGFFPKTLIQELPLDDEKTLNQSPAQELFTNPSDFDSAFGDDDWSSSVFISMAFSGDTPQTTVSDVTWSSTIGWKPREEVSENIRAVAIITFLDEEQIYLNTIQEFLSNFLHPIKEIIKKETPSLDPHELNAMFVYFQPMYDNHKLMFELLSKRVDSVADDGSLCVLIGDLLRDTKWMHEIYVKYAAISSLLYEAIILAQQSKVLAPLFKAKRKYITKENLHEIVDSPLKRIAQYAEFLSKVADATPKTHDDYNTITEVSTSLRTTADVVAATREHTGSIDSRVKSVYKRLQPKLLSLLSPTQCLKHEGRILQWLKEDSGDALRERYFFLFNDALLLVSGSSDSEVLQLRLYVTLSTTRIEKAPLPASILSEKWGVTEDNDSPLAPRSILLHTPKKSILLFTMSEKERQQFLDNANVL